MNKRSAACSRARVHHDAGGLLNYGEILIFEVDLERELLCSEWDWFEWADIELNPFPAPDLISSLFLAAFNADRDRTVE